MKQKNYSERGTVYRFFAHVIRSAGLVVRGVFVGLVLTFTLTGIVGVLFGLYLYSQVPDYRNLTDRDAPESSKLFSRDGTLLYEFHGEVKRTSVPLDRINENLKHATIAIEDKDFYNHGAVSLSSIGRAILANYETGQVTEGGSTITQQLVKNALLTREKSFTRKFSEMILSYQIEGHYSKDEILSLYLNEIPYGRNTYGAEAASQAYFGKSAMDVNLAESAYLAALPQAPSYYSPTGQNVEELENRKDKVLRGMYEQGYITEGEMSQAQFQKVAFNESRVTLLAPHFVGWVQNILTEKYGDKFLKEGGLKVYTTLDLRLQGLAEQAVKEGAEKNKTANRAYNAALVATDPSTGKVLAMAGGKDYWGTAEPKGCTPGLNCKFEPKANVAISSRQPGSSFKPFVYATAFSENYGYSAYSRVLDTPRSYGTVGGRAYVPQNYDGSSRGWLTIRKALAGSLNVPAVRILNDVGVKNATEVAKGLGISTPLQNCGLSLVLGGCEVRLVDHTAAFGALSNMGEYNGNTPFNKIEDKYGNILEEYKPEHRQVLNPEAAYVLTDILTDDEARQYVFGRDNPLTLPGRKVACKTGTTQNWKDGWTMCYTPQLAVGVWTGNNDSSLMRAGADGVFTAAPIWHNFMESALAGQPALDWPIPEGIVMIKVDNNTGKPVPVNSRSGVVKPFAWYALPTELKTVGASSNSPVAGSSVAPASGGGQSTVPVTGGATSSGGGAVVSKPVSTSKPVTNMPSGSLNARSGGSGDMQDKGGSSEGNDRVNNSGSNQDSGAGSSPSGNASGNVSGNSRVTGGEATGGTTGTQTGQNNSHTAEDPKSDRYRP